MPLAPASSAATRARCRGCRAVGPSNGRAANGCGKLGRPNYARGDDATMEMRKLGRTGLRVAALCLGGNTFGWTTDQETSEAVLDAYVTAGGNFIDTADVYARWAPGNTGGESETV